ncbi:MAG: chorismate synthase, partial [Candidatus Omnitrophica bacterium]|nr:chorismate synthase [Candidatus Omnitrophota bacterium]
GVPPNIPLTEADIQFELDRRKPGQSRVTTQRKESDSGKILSGVFEGKTTGTALAILIYNEDHRSKDYSNIMDKFRPGHADFTFFKKYGCRDYRGGGRSSGRETACRVAAGAVAKKILDRHGVKVIAYSKEIAGIPAEKIDYSVIEKNIVRAPDLEAAKKMIEKIDEARKSLDSVGGIIEAVVHGCPAGLGDPVFDKLNARLAYAVMTIGTIRGVEFGKGFDAAKMKASQHNDKFYMDGDHIRTTSNHAGGILGGISTGDNIIMRMAVKPPSSIAQPQKTVTESGEQATIEVKGRHDPCICPRVVPVVESMIALSLVDALMRQSIINPYLPKNHHDGREK